MPKHILIIEDDSDFRFMLRRAFERAGYVVSEAANGRFGLEVAARSAPELVVTDIFMPELEGIETIVKLREAAPETKIVAISGRMAIAGYDALESARKLGADAVLRKPFMPRDLLRLVAELLAGDGLRQSA